MSLLEERPESVEEAGALLGAAITLCGTGAATVNAPPKGMHSAFATMSSVPSSDLFTRLYYLRALLRALPPEEPLVAAPSLLAVLMKLLSTSTDMAAKTSSQGGISSSSAVQKGNNEVPPMLSTPLRSLWVDCVVICHRLGEGLSGTARTSLFSFLKSMVALGGMNPRTVKAGGGARLAALDAIAGLMEEESLAPKLAGWSHDVLQLSLRALRSAGNGEPSYRIAAVKMACAVAKACRVAHLKSKPAENPRHAMLLQGALEGPVVIESIKILRQAIADKFPEVRSASATFAALVAPMLVLPPRSRPSNNPLERGEQSTAPIILHLEEVLSLALKNIDDEMVEVAAGWAEALARCICTAVEVGARKASSAIANRDVEADQDQAPSAETGTQRNTRRKDGPVALCKDLKSAIALLVRNFVKVGGELSAARAGGMYSIGGRAVRIGLSNCLTKFLRIQSTLGMIGDESGLSLEETVKLVLQMAGEDVGKQFMAPPSTQTLDVTTVATPGGGSASGSGNALFGSKKSVADAGLVRLATGNVLRLGISELVSETTQLSLLQCLLQLLNPQADAEQSSKLQCNNAYQLQVVLIEISHLLTALGEAAGSKVDNLVTSLKVCLSHADHGVRYEAAVACGAFVSSFPSEGRKMLMNGLEDLQQKHAELMGVANSGESVTSTGGVSSDTKRTGGLGRMFRRPKKELEKPKVVDLSYKHQCAIHGISLMVSILVRELPRVPGGIAKNHVSEVLSMAEMLVSCQFNDVITNSNPAVACTCVRAGFGIIAGILATGHVAVETHTKKIFNILQKSYKSSIKGTGGKFGVDFDLSCIEVVLSSIVAFLSYCSELLLTVPECLTKVNVMLEELLLSFSPEGRFGSESSNPAAVIRLKSSKASLMEAFAWLPSGSFPMAADAVFAFAAQQIRSAITGEVTCSILPSLVTKEDLILDSKSVSRVERAGQVGGAKEIEESVVTLTSEAAQHGEREAVLHFPGSHAPLVCDREFRNSQILGMFTLESAQPPPTPLHAAVGTWRKPLDVSCSSAVRLLDAAIQAFAATFGLKGGNEQQEAVEMLESLVPPFLTQLAGTIGMNTALAEQATRNKPKEDNAAVANITAVLLACLKALPLHEATHNVAIGLGPPWMNKAKEVLLTLLPSSSNIVRRAAAEGLALLATLGVSEDAHFLQSSVLHSLDQVMQGNLPDGKPRIAFEPVSASRAGSLLTFACIQRMNQRVSQTKMDRSKGRTLSAEEVILKDEETLPTLQMMTRILPSISRQGFRDFFIVQTTGLHTFGLLLGYSSKLDKDNLEAEDLQLLRKGVELVDDNFINWTAASADFDAGQEGEKLGAEVSFLGVLVRLMTLLLSSLHHIHSENPAVASKFSCMVTLIMEKRGSHPVICVECMAFNEVLAKNQGLLPPLSTKMMQSDNPIFSCIPYCIASLKPSHAEVLLESQCDISGCLSSTRGLQAVLRALRVMSGLLKEYDMKLASSAFAFLEAQCTSRCLGSYRPLAAPRAAELVAIEGLATEKEASELLHALQRPSPTTEAGLLRWILFCRAVVTNQSSRGEVDSGVPAQSVEAIAKKAEATAVGDASRVFEHVGQVRWQIKSTAIILALRALEQMRQSSGTSTHSPNFNYKLAEESIQRAFASGSVDPPSRLVLHLSHIVPMACSFAVAAVDQAELPTLQLAGVLFLSKVVACFSGTQDPHQPDALLLDQYNTQIFASVKHSLGDPDDISGEAYYKLFFGGCESIQTIVENEITKDPVSLKRIIRPTIPSANETPFFSFGESFVRNSSSGPASEKTFDNERASLLVHIGKVWTTSKLLLMKGKASNMATPVQQLIEDEASLAVHAAAVAFDGARLLLGADATLCGDSAPESGTVDGKPHKGFLYDNVGDVEESVKAVMVMTWSSCGSFALRSLVQKSSNESDESRKQSCALWIRKLVPLLDGGLNDCINAFGGKDNERASPAWCKGAESSEIAVNCLYGLRVFAEESSPWSNYEDVGINMEQILDRLREFVILPLLGQSGGGPEENDEPPARLSLLPLERQAALLEEICDLIKELAAAKTSKASSALLISILKPLDLLQRNVIDYSHSHVELIISTSLVAASTLISLSKTEDSFVSSLTRMSLDMMSARALPSSVSNAVRTLLKSCLSHKAVSANDRCVIAKEVAKSGDWETWFCVCAEDDGLAAAGSMEVVKKVLLDPQNSQQLEALSALRQLAQTPNNSVLVGRIMQEAGVEILNIFKMYGGNGAFSRSKRPAACADAMKIAVVACQQLSDAVEEQVYVAFLMVVFEYMLMVLRYNGLPNHPPPQAESDPSLGSMMAKAVVFVARASPAPFKTTLASMQDADRGALEFAVRAEMTGYANASAQAPTKKKLNLKGFGKK